MTPKEAFLCFKNNDLHPYVRSAYLEFFISTLLDVNVEESGTPIGDMWYTFVSLAMCSTLSHIVL